MLLVFCDQLIIYFFSWTVKIRANFFCKAR